MCTFSLTIVRHGETQYNRDKLLQGQGVDTPLSETGRQQAAAAGRYLRDIKFDNVFVSNLLRTQETAEILLWKNTHSSGKEMVLEPLLRERSFGIAEGHPKEYLKNLAISAGQSCRDFTPPGGETIAQVKQRFQKFLKVLFQRMVDDHGWSEPTPCDVALESTAAAAAPGPAADDGLAGVSVHALVVSHGAYIRVAIRHLVEDFACSLPPGVKLSQLYALCGNTGISRFVLSLSPSRSGVTLSAARCVFTNRLDHLRDPQPAE